MNVLCTAQGISVILYNHPDSLISLSSVIESMYYLWGAFWVGWLKEKKR